MDSELKQTTLFYGAIMLVVVIVALLLSITMASINTEVEITVEDKWIKATKDSSDYMISDTSGNVYVVSDSLILLSFDASDRYAAIDVGRTYGVTTIGWRVPMLSMYPNIVEINYCTLR